MDALVGFHVDSWDYLTFAATFIIVPAVLTLAVLIRGLPGGIAFNLMGYIGILAVVPWVKALTWAFKPTDVVRYTPGEER